MKKICVLAVSIFFLMVSVSFAEPTPREATPSVGKSAFTNIAVVGLDLDGNDGSVHQGIPGYVEMTSTAGNVYYLFIDSAGLLRIASATEVGQGASPAIIGWGDSSGKIVGTQVDD